MPKISTISRSAASRLLTLAVAVMCVFSVSGRQSVGLVLSGGGAKGCAHIGVIRALEEHNIPIDYIAGTSMGAIIGGLYAAGYTPDEMMELLKSKDFAYWSTGRIDPTWTYYYEKPQKTPAQASFYLNLRDSVALTSVLPTSLINPLPMNFAFMELFAKYTAQCGGNFDRLFVPFRCVTSDVYAKHKIVCRLGSFADAIRASMSFPLVFQPIEMDGVLVYDGGIYDNFPVDVMHEDFNPDIMIGVNVSGPDKKPQENNLMQQLEDMIIQNNDYNLPAAQGIKMDVPVRMFGLLDFDKCEEISRIGYETAMAMMDSISTRVTARRPAEEVEARRLKFKAHTPTVMFDSVNVTGASPKQNEYIKYIFTHGHNDEAFTMADARDSYYRAITPGKLRNLVPKAVLRDSTGLFTLNLNADVKNQYKVGVGGYVNTSTSSMLFLSCGYETFTFNSLSTSLDGWIGQSYLAGEASAKLMLRTSHPSYIMFQGVISRQKKSDNDRIFYDDGTLLVTESELFSRLRYGMSAGRSGLLEVDLGVGRLSNRFFDALKVTDADRDRATSILGQVRLNYEQSTLNDFSYATTGRFIKSTLIGVYGNYRFLPFDRKEFEQRNNHTSWAQLEVNFEQYFPVSKHFVCGIESNLMISTQPLRESYGSSVVMSPAFHPTPATYNSFGLALRAPKYFTFGVQPILKISDMLQLRGEFHGFMPWQRILPGEPAADGTVTARYGRRLADPEFFGEISAVYALPFAHLAAYADYSTDPGIKWNFGISLGLFFLAPRFMK